MDGIVFSTEFGRMCPDCGKPIDGCVCRAEQAPPAGDGIVRLCRETKGRKGKGVTVITGLPLTNSEMKQLARELKARCGCGGTLRDGVIEIQGDKRDLLKKTLEEKGYKVKIAGG
ncbi:MAG: translation initiation factor Sui1 [Phycisphaerae bacterium]|jgi:translation initiation factor 1